MTVKYPAQGRQHSGTTLPRRKALHWKASCVLAMGLLLSAGLLQAQPERGQGRVPPQNNLLQDQVDAPESQDPRTRISRREASELARDRFSGRVLSIRLDEGRWRVRMDQDGTVFNVLVDAATGDVARAAD